jgi:hypothetical protein
MDYVATSCPHRGVDTVLDEYDDRTVSRLRCRYCHERVGKHQQPDLYQVHFGTWSDQWGTYPWNASPKEVDAIRARGTD